MSLNPRDLTQGGQVAFMRLKMFLQINNLRYHGHGVIWYCRSADANKHPESDSPS
ncbi:hypothetical protein JR406_004562 [Escherichia coli]|nr:hypothetical protein [Escherichia coli]EHC7952004.1 hypothetical protein [Escherichia coli]